MQIYTPKNINEMEQILKLALTKIANADYHVWTYGFNGWLRKVLGGYDVYTADPEVLEYARNAVDSYYNYVERCAENNISEIQCTNISICEMVNALISISQETEHYHYDYGTYCYYEKTIGLAKKTLELVENI